MINALRRPHQPRRGVTLVEMLVVVALVVLMMVILVQIFQSALGAMSASRTTQELDVTLRAIDSMIRTDLNGVTAKMTPPNDPELKQGYFEYGEGAQADIQGEDTDDFLAFTTKAPEGQVFTGRQYLTGNLGNGVAINNTIQPITITSQIAEVIYFLRNGNLYRRVFLVVPDRSKTISVPKIATTYQYTQDNGGGYATGIFGGNPSVSWQGLNDVSSRPGGMNVVVDANNNKTYTPKLPILNDLGDLTNRENRAFRPRFINDFADPSGTGLPDGVPDDSNGDGLPDYYPTLYYNGSGYSQQDVNNNAIGWAPNHLVNEATSYLYLNNNTMTPRNPQITRVNQTATNYDVYAFPFIFPGMYSVPDQSRVANGLGWVHQMFPNTSNPPNPQFPYGYVNHSPLDIGETSSPNITPTANQTWWGFPTWRETMAGIVASNGYTRLGWADPMFFVGYVNAQQKVSYNQPLGLRPIPPTQLPAAYLAANLLPPVYQPGGTTPPPYYDGVGSPTFVSAPISPGSSQSMNPNPVWEDDLILTNVRSFDVKAYDPDAPLYNNLAGQNVAANNNLFSVGYQDLGYGGVLNGLVANNNGLQVAVPFQGTDANGVSLPPTGFGHEGRMPPIHSDYRNNPKRYGFNVGELLNLNSQTHIIRLTHTFDTWSTAYTNAPDTDAFLNGTTTTYPNPIYPSFPPPYPSPLRGIQIKIRVTDPRLERTKVLTITHDFTDKL